MIDITSILSFIAGRIQTLKPRSKSVAVKIGQSVATIESGKYFGAVRSPVDAKLLEFNPELSQNPCLIVDSPYNDG